MSEKAEPCHSHLPFSQKPATRKTTISSALIQIKFFSILQRARYFLRSGLRGTIAKLRPFLANSGEIRADFSALQTVWRRARHSNLRYPFE